MIKQLFSEVPKSEIYRSYRPPNMVRVPPKNGRKKASWNNTFLSRTGVEDDYMLRKYFSADESYYNRNIIVVRNYIDAVVSGYLYHKSGRECWSNPDGTKMKGTTYKMQNYHWWDDVRLTNMSKEEANGRTLCQFLSDESEDVGMQIFVEISWRHWWKKYMYFLEKVRDLENPTYRRTRIVCYEDLNNPATQRQTFHDMMGWLYPSGNYHGEYDPAPVQKEYTGNHSTDHDAGLRRRLRSAVVRYDEELLNRKLAIESELNGCGVD